MSAAHCLHCNCQLKLPDHQFCSQACIGAASSWGPRLIPISPCHVLYQKVARQFYEHWENCYSPPQIAMIYHITWSEQLRVSYENYRSQIACMRGLNIDQAEVKRFRAERRACRLGEPGYEGLCNFPPGQCRLCTAIRTGFAYSLQSKRQSVYQGIQTGVRFGGGLYMAPSSSKAYQYAENMNNCSQYKAVLMARVVLGNAEQMWWEDHTKLAPSPGYDSVETCIPGEPKELVVYNEDAARPAYLILLH